MRKTRADGWWYPWIFVGGLVIVVIVNGIMLTFAINTWSGFETEGHNRKGLVYNENLTAAEAQARIGWRPEVKLGNDGPDGKRTLAVLFKGADARPLDGLSIRVRLTRPAQSGHDLEAELVAQGDGRYSAEISLPLVGVWDVRVLAQRGEDRHQSVHRVMHSQ